VNGIGADRLDGELGGVVVVAHTDPTGVCGEVLDTIGVGLAQVSIDEVVNLDLGGFAAGAPFPSAVLAAGALTEQRTDHRGQHGGDHLPDREEAEHAGQNCRGRRGVGRATPPTDRTRHGMRDLRGYPARAG